MTDRTGKEIDDLVRAVERLAEKTVKGADQVVEPYRRSAFSRFPFLFTFLGVVGAAAVIHGSERLLDAVPFLNEHPLLIIAVGLVILALTGTLHKRLS